MRCHPESGVVAVRLRSHWMRTLPFSSHHQCAGERNIFLFWAMVLRKPVSLLLFFRSFTENLGTTSPRMMGSLEMWQAPLPKLLGNRPCPPIKNTSEGCFHMLSTSPHSSLYSLPGVGHPHGGIASELSTRVQCSSQWAPSSCPSLRSWRRKGYRGKRASISVTILPMRVYFPTHYSFILKDVHVD